jgi:hypothetical protein
MAAKIVPNTSNRGITPGPKLAARPIIHKRMANVKIVQNTALLQSWCSPQKSCGSVYGYVALRDLFSVMGFDFGTVPHNIRKEPAYCSDPEKSPAGCFDLSSNGLF